MLDTIQQTKLRTAFQTGKLLVKSISPQGELAWKRVEAVHRAEVGPEAILEVTTAQGVAVLTGGHHVFLTPTYKVEAERLQPGDTTNGNFVKCVRSLPLRRYMYDLTAADWHNFILHRSGMLVSNSPDRNYHFRPPSHEETIRQYNRVFGFIWEDEELVEYLERGVDMVIAAPPRTPFNGIDGLARDRPEWKTLVLTGAMIYALNALRINWIADEFDYSIGGVSLAIDKASKYESAAQMASDQFDKQLEKAKATVKIIKGLQQPKYGTGIRSAFGPFTGRGVLTPAKFVGFVIPFILSLHWLMDLARRL